MAERARKEDGKAASAALGPGPLMNALPDPVIAVDRDDRLAFANAAAEQFFLFSETLLLTKRLDDLIAAGSPLLALVGEARRRDASFAEHDLALAFVTGEHHAVDVQVSPVPDWPGYVLVRMEPRTLAEKISRQLIHRGAVRSVAGVATMLAHEIKNPLSGIKGAAQLLEETVGVDERPLAQLICKEAERINALVDDMEVFSDNRPMKRGPENIHAVLDHVIALAAAGFAKGQRIEKRYDPSLPPVDGNWDFLAQAFLNLVKNAAEAVAGAEGEIVVATAYTHGMRIALPGTRQRMMLPIEVTITDNGPGVPEDLMAHLFEPFITTKPNGKGLGLALVAKLIGDHGGVVDCESMPGRTQFRILLPAAQEA